MVNIEIDGPGLQRHTIPVEANSTILLAQRSIDGSVWYVLQVDETDYKLVPVDQQGSFRAMQHAIDGFLGRLLLEMHTAAFAFDSVNPISKEQQ